MNQQVILVASNAAGGSITAWDAHAGTAITTYKGNASPANGLSLLGRDYLISAQLGKGSLHVWTWHKDQVHLRSFAPEPLSAVACSPDGALCAAGGASGAIHIWETSTGRLLRSWPAHYKRVTCLAFSDSGAALVSGGEDTLVAAWLLCDVLDAAVQPGGAGLQPLHSWSDHTMPVVAVAVGAGDGNALVVSAASDRTVKIRLLAQGALLRSVALPAPPCSLALDPGEHAVYAGASDGSIYDVSLVGGAGSDSLLGGSGPADGVGSMAGAQEGEGVAMEGHTRAVSCLALTADAAHLVSGGEDGSVRVWDLRSRQPVRVLAAPVKGPVTGLIVLDRPEFMPAVGGKGEGASGRRGPTRPQPMAVFAKYANAQGAVKPWEGGLVLIDGSGDDARLELLEEDDDGMEAGTGVAATSAEEAAAGAVLGAAAGAAGRGGGGAGAAPPAPVAGEAQDQWGSVTAQLQQFVTDELLG